MDFIRTESQEVSGIFMGYLCFFLLIGTFLYYAVEFLFHIFR